MKQFLLTLWQRPKWQFVLFYGIGLIYIFLINPTRVSYHHVPEAVVVEFGYTPDRGNIADFQIPNDPIKRSYEFKCEPLNLPHCSKDGGQAKGKIILVDFHYAIYEHRSFYVFHNPKRYMIELLSATIISDISNTQYQYQSSVAEVQRVLRFDRIARPILMLAISLVLTYAISAIGSSIRRILTW